MAREVHGILNVLKPPGLTSMEVVRRLKRLTRQRHVGHGGTLDPLAEGVLPICFGQATRLMEFLVEGVKVYRARVRLGVATDTYDAEGRVTFTADPSHITREQVEAALASFQGFIQQIPPMYSALKREGRRLYQLAREGVEVPREPRRVYVHRIQLVEWEPPELTLEVEVGRGVYIRSLAHDLGQALGVGAHLTGMVRLRAGPFTLDDATPLDRVEEAVRGGTWTDLLYAGDVVLADYPAAVVGPGLERYIRQGRYFSLHRGLLPLHIHLCRVYTVDGRFLAVARYDRVQGLWHPDRVFSMEPLPDTFPAR